MKRLIEEIVKLYIALIFTFFILYYTDNYYNILVDKQDAFRWLTYGLIIVFLFLSFIRIIYRIIKKQFSLRDSLRGFKKGIQPLDVVVFLFAVVALISTCLSEDPEWAFTGEMAWFVGCETILLGTTAYFIISRNFSRRLDLWFYIYIGSFAALLIGVIDRLGFDFLVMHDEIPLQYEIFISTIGNVNFWSGFVSILVPCFAVAPLFFKGYGARFFSYVFVLVAYFSLFATLANTTYLGIGIGMLYVTYYCLQEKSGLKNLSINMILFMVAGMIANILAKNELTPRPLDMDSATEAMLKYGAYYVVGVVGIALLLVVLYTKSDFKKLLNICSRLWLGVIAVFAIALIGYTATHYSLEIFNWRGTIWYFTWNGFLEGSIKDQIIGIGPGLLDYVSEIQIANADFYVYWDYYYNTAHNDILEYLLTMGVLGVGLRLAMYIIPYTMLKRAGENKTECVMIMAGLTGFIGQGLMIGPQILVYAIYMMFLAMLRGYCNTDIRQPVVQTEQVHTTPAEV